jgi:hypothetical protein
LRWCRGRAGAHHEDRREDPEQPQRAKGSHNARRGPCARPCACLLGGLSGDLNGGYGGCGLYGAPLLRLADA